MKKKPQLTEKQVLIASLLKRLNNISKKSVALQNETNAKLKEFDSKKRMILLQIKALKK